MTASDRVQQHIEKLYRIPGGPFFLSGLAGRPVTEGAGGGGMATDNATLRYDSEWVMARDSEELLYTLIHEATHNILGHTRAVAYFNEHRPADMDLIRRAIEAECNCVCMSEGIGKPPAGITTANMLDLPDDLSWRDYYATLRARRDQQESEEPDDELEPDGEPESDSDESPDGNGDGTDEPEDSGQPEDEADAAPDSVPDDEPGEESDDGDSDEAGPDAGDGPADQSEEGPPDSGTPDGDGADSPASDGPLSGDCLPDAEGAPESETEMEAEQVQKFIEAMAQSEACGTAPGVIRARYEDMLKRSRNDYRSLLRQMLQPQLGKRTWHKRSRKFLSNPDIIMPGKGRGSGLRTLICAVDVSGSTLSYRSAFLAEFVQVAKQYPRCEYIVVPWNDGVIVDGVQTLTGYEMASKTPDISYSGGTCVAPVFEWIASEYPAARGAVILTDGWFYDLPETPPPFPVLWVLTPNCREPAWGMKGYV